MSCQSCSMIEGFTNETPAYLSAQLDDDARVGTPTPPSQYVQYMKSECNYAAQACIYTAQGEVVCPKEGLGNCEENKQNHGSFFGIF